MNETPPLYVRVASRFTEVLGGVTDDQWALPTPCSEWTVRDLVVHVVETQRRVHAMSGAVAEGDEAPVGDDLVAEWTAASNEVQRAIADPDVASVMVGGRMGDQRFDSLVGGLLSIDTLCHTWDLARATGQNETLDVDAVASAHEKLRAVDAAIRVPGGFKEALEPPPDADAQTTFLCFTGREV